jgi:hypothetical protein
MTTNVEAIRRLFQVDASRDRAGNLPSMTGICSDYPAPIVRNGNGGRELATARWGMPSSSKALMDATKKRGRKAAGEGQDRRFQGIASDGARWRHDQHPQHDEQTLDEMAGSREPLRGADFTAPRN